MAKYGPEPAFTHGSVPAIGVLLVNLGTPDAATPAAVRRYLAEFLSDPRVVEIPRPVWWPILHGIVLNTRPQKTAKKYAAIWTAEGSPLRVYTERQTQMLRGYLGETVKAPLAVTHAMRYGTRSIAEAVAELKAKNCERILVLPLYPQYAASTTATVMDALAATLATQRNVPALRFVRSFHDHPAYIDAVVANVLAYWMKSGRPDFRTDRVVMTFHGLPRFHLDRGDPYHCQCQKTARLVAEQLGLAKDEYVVTFQSRFGRTEWLKPYTDATLAALAKSGVKRVDLICPGFAADCLETLEEIAIAGKATFMNAGGASFNYIPVANDSQPWVAALRDIVLENLQGWIDPQWNRPAAEAAARASAERAKALGAPT